MQKLTPIQSIKTVDTNVQTAQVTVNKSAEINFAEETVQKFWLIISLVMQQLPLLTPTLSETFKGFRREAIDATSVVSAIIREQFFERAAILNRVQVNHLISLINTYIFILESEALREKLSDVLSLHCGITTKEPSSITHEIIEMKLLKLELREWLIEGVQF